MSLSTMINGRVQAPAAYWKFELSPSFQPSPNINYICVPTTVEFKDKIISLLQTLSFLPYQSVLVQYWAAKEAGNSIVLTTTGQPAGIWGNNKELESYHKVCLDHKLYVHPKKGVAFGLPGRVFLNRTYEQTLNVHEDEDQRPPCDVIFTKIWGSFAVPLIDNDKCFGVLEFVVDTGNASYNRSYDDYIAVVCNALKHAGFQSSFRTDHVTRTCVNPPKRFRKTSSSSFTRYSRLVPYFGLSSVDAATKLQETTVKPVTPGTFRNACRNVGIPEWPWISKGKIIRDSSDLETQVNPYASGTSSFASSIATEYMPSWNTGISNSSCVQNTTTQAPLFEYLTNQIECDTSSSQTPVATKYGSFGFPGNSDFMAYNTGYFGAPFATQYSSFIAPISSEYSSSGALIDAEYMASENSSLGSLTATYHMSDDSSLNLIQDGRLSEWSYTQSMATTDTSQTAYDASSFMNPYATQYIESDATSSWAPLATKYGSFTGPFATEDILTLFEEASPSKTLINQNTSGAGGCIDPLVEFRNDFMQDSNEMKDVDVRDKFPKMLSDFDNWASQNISDYQ
ncbi:hypothetical protein R6Q57_012501 [Mikania cordata]